MTKYRKMPIEVEAIQWFKNSDHPEDKSVELTDKEGSKYLSEGKIIRYYRTPKLDGQNKCKHCNEIMHFHGWIDTIQGGHIVCPGDWIITDDRVEKDKYGHYYPCKPDIFEQTYEEVKILNL